MSSIIECDNCGYNRSSEDDGKQFFKVCGICYLETCPTPVGDVNLCAECNDNESLKQYTQDDWYLDIIYPGE